MILAHSIIYPLVMLKLMTRTITNKQWIVAFLLCFCSRGIEANRRLRTSSFSIQNNDNGGVQSNEPVSVQQQRRKLEEEKMQHDDISMEKKDRKVAKQLYQGPIYRDLFIDERTGQGYARVPALTYTTASSTFSSTTNIKAELFTFEPYGQDGGHRILMEFENESSNSKQKRILEDTTKPTISGVTPYQNQTLSSNTFEVSAIVTDDVKVKTVTATLVNLDSGRSSKVVLSFTGNNNIWSKTVQTIAGASLKMTITAKDTSQNTRTTRAITFRSGNTTASTRASAGGGESGLAVADSPWTDRNASISLATGRILFQMNDTGTLSTYACSGTLVQLPSSSSTPDRSVVITAAHCVYDDVKKEFARNVMFIPQQDDGGTDRSDRNCSNDALGCLTMEFGFVSSQYASRTFPHNCGADYGFYVTKSTTTDEKGKSIGINGDIVPMLVKFGSTRIGAGTFSMGYSYANDPNFTYAYDKLEIDTSGGLANDHWLASSTFSAGSSGGPWTQHNPSDGVVKIMGTNSWSYAGKPGIAASPLNTGGAACVYNASASIDLDLVRNGGLVVTCSK